jgi:iron complex outermembrane receptor protein
MPIDAPMHVAALQLEAERPTAGEQADLSSEDIVVTGSRIPRRGQDSTHVLVVDGTRLEQNSAITVEASLNQFPQFTASVGAADAFPPRGGQSQLNLRGLGTNRSLILVDGRRIQPANPDGTVDVNLIPPTLVSRVEVITGGASTAYGSDAMSGVINFILRRDFEGIQLDGQLSTTTRGDGGTRSLSATAGEQFAGGKGRATFSISYASRDQVQRMDRDFFRVTIANARLPYATALLAAAPPTQAAVDTLFRTYGFANGSVPRTAPLGTNPDGTLFSSPGTAPVVNYRGPLNDSYLILNNAVLFSSGRTYDIQIPLQRLNLTGYASYEIAPDIEAYGQVYYTDYDAVATAVPVSLGALGQNGSVSVANPFIPQDLWRLLATRTNPAANFPITYSFSQLGPMQHEFEYDIHQFQLGLRGRSGPWSFDVYGSMGRTQSDTTLRNGLSLLAVQRLLTAADGGASLCSGGFNPFGAPEGLSPDCRAYISREPVSRAEFEQEIVEATAHRGWFALPGGDLRTAFGLGFRRDTYVQTPDLLYQTGELLGFAIALPSQGRQKVYEAFAEAQLPILGKSAIGERLDLTLAYRYSDYSTIGGVHTYKADASWQLWRWLAFRGGYSRAIRAPSLGDLYSPATTTSVSIGQASPTSATGDPCDTRSLYRNGPNAMAVRGLCLAQGVPATVIDSFAFTSQTIFASVAGNPNLSEEKADTFSVGATFRAPSQGPLSGLVLSADFYDITIRDAIGSLPFATGLARCFNVDGSSNPNYDPTNINCVVVARNSVGTISNGLIPTLNLAKYHTQGIDLSVQGRFSLARLLRRERAGEIGFEVAATRILSFDLVTLPGTPSLDYSGYTSSPINSSVLPKWRANATLQYQTALGSLGIRWRFIGRTQDISRLTSPTSTVPGVREAHYFDLFARIAVDERLSLRAGIQDLTDKGPPPIGTSLGFTDVQTYDLLGRSAYVGASVKF